MGALCNVEVVAFSCCAGAVKPSYICQVRLSSHSGLFVCCVDVIIAAYFMYRIADGADNSWTTYQYKITLWQWWFSYDDDGDDENLDERDIALCECCNGEVSMINFQFLFKNITFTF